MWRDEVKSESEVNSKIDDAGVDQKHHREEEGQNRSLPKEGTKKTKNAEME